jgi:hypothetical protein
MLSQLSHTPVATNVSIIAAAASDRKGEAQFECARSMGRFSKIGKTTVRTIHMEELGKTVAVAVAVVAAKQDWFALKHVQFSP